MAPSDPDVQAALDAWIERAFAELEAAGGDPVRLSEPFRTIVVITACQGVIDNGGLRLFFENDWPGQPPYATFADAYRRVGARHSAEAIESAARLFPCARPESEQARRRQVLAGPTGAEVDALTPTDEDVWAALALYLRSRGDSGEVVTPE